MDVFLVDGGSAHIAQILKDRIWGGMDGFAGGITGCSRLPHADPPPENRNN